MIRDVSLLLVHGTETKVEMSADKTGSCIYISAQHSSDFDFRISTKKSIHEIISHFITGIGLHIMYVMYLESAAID